MTREAVERHQVWLYLAAAAAGLLLSGMEPGLGGVAEALLWPALALLLLATFTQVPLSHVSAALRDPRFMAVLFGAHFLVLPLLVAALLALAPEDPALRLGMALVLLVPCTDWAITFTHLARGDTAAIIAAAPPLLGAQFLLLPGFLWALLGSEAVVGLPAGRLLIVFVLLIALPLALAWSIERWAARSRAGARARNAAGAWPVPLLVLVVLLVALTQGAVIRAELPRLAGIAALFLVFLAAALAIAAILGRAARLPAAQQRALAISLGTRNSFVVLPLALALPAGLEAAAVVIVVQSLVELLGILACLRLLPRWFR